MKKRTESFLVSDIQQLWKDFQYSSQSCSHFRKFRNVNFSQQVILEEQPVLKEQS